MSHAIKKQFSLDFQWPTQEPFLFCVHHLDRYPNGTPTLGPAQDLLKGRDMGQDFTPKDGFRMYHGDEVPGFPVHPHRGFETITIVRRGYVDHADSLGAAGRYGEGDVQWMTAGQGVQHSEMFPLLRKDSENTLELFQVWLNLPKKNKMAPPHFKMLWSEDIPKLSLPSGDGELSIIAGEFGGARAIAPPPDSWASDPTSQTAIWLLRLRDSRSFDLPTTQDPIGRTLYFFAGKSLSVNDTEFDRPTGAEVDSTRAVRLTARGADAEVLILQSRAIGEPTVQYGPFVMNTKEEIQQAFADYQATRFGGWPWDRDDMIHGTKIERFARHPGGREERRPAGRSV